MTYATESSYRLTEAGTGTQLRVERATGAAFLAVTEPGMPAGVISVDAADFPALTRALWKAAGLPAPVMLPRPEVADDGGTSWAGSLACRVGPIVRIRPGQADLSPAAARLFAGTIAVLADEADTEPDPETVKTLAALIDGAECITGDTPGLAAALLRAGVRLDGGAQ